MNSLTAEKRYQFAKWAEVIKSCKSSDMQVSEWLKQNNISKDQYYYWHRKLKDACLESLQAEQSTFVELPVDVPQVCEHKSVVKKVTIKTNTSNISAKNIVVATVKLSNASIDIYDNASPEFIRNFLEVFMHAK